MFATARVALRPENEAPRRSWQTERDTANYVNNNIKTPNNTDALRVQRLRLLGIIGQRAALIAALAGGTLAMADHQANAMALITAGVPLKPREGQFLGGIAFDANPLTEKQANWLRILLDRHGLADTGGAA